MAGSPSVRCCQPASPRIAARPRHVAAFKALAHHGRLRVFFALVSARHALTVSEIQTAVRMPAPTLSHHLDHLERAGLIARRKQERFIFSDVRRDAVMDMVRLLTDCC